ncbi:hypothetical protein [Streptomyces sp. LUP30]|uniref:hypothetical protein n=1 Tax=Streptomyces sp. LUP30 TaxID=1890285 RepID=UPI00114CD2C3|nr:hypothetical protein [Streptomyces sp. LUP30]
MAREKLTRSAGIVLLVVSAAVVSGCSGGKSTPPSPSVSKAALVSDPDNPDKGAKTPGRLGPGTVKLPVAADRIAALSVRYDCLGSLGGLQVSNGTALRAGIEVCDDSATYGASMNAKDLDGRKFGGTVKIEADKRTRWRVSVSITDKDGVKQTVHS